MTNPVLIKSRYIFCPIDQAQIDLADFPNHDHAERYFEEPVRLLFRRSVYHEVHHRSQNVEGDIAVSTYEQNSTSNLRAVLNYSAFYCDSDALLKEQITPFFTLLDISCEAAHLTFLDKIKILVQQKRYPVSVSGNTVTLVAEIRIVKEYVHYVYDDEETILQFLLEESTRQTNHGMVPASKSAIFKALNIEKIVTKRKRDDDDNDEEELESCPICMDEFPIQAYVTKMPCDHRFHGQCIVKWLKTSHFCPVCRFEISTE